MRYTATKCKHCGELVGFAEHNDNTGVSPANAVCGACVFAQQAVNAFAGREVHVFDFERPRLEYCMDAHTIRNNHMLSIDAEYRDDKLKGYSQVTHAQGVWDYQFRFTLEDLEEFAEDLFTKG